MTGKPAEPETDDARLSDTPDADRTRDDMAKAAEKGLRKAASDNEEAEPATPTDDGGK
jgi:hypothetical protein